MIKYSLTITLHARSDPDTWFSMDLDNFLLNYPLTPGMEISLGSLGNDHLFEITVVQVMPRYDYDPDEHGPLLEAADTAVIYVELAPREAAGISTAAELLEYANLLYDIGWTFVDAGGQWATWFSDAEKEHGDTEPTPST